MTTQAGKSGGGKPFCPDCGKAATGNFCQSCGAKLGGRFCNKCGSKLSGGAKFCNQCGDKALGGGGSGQAAAAVMGGQNMPWWIAGVAMFGLILVVGMQMVGPDSPAPGAQGVPAGGPATGQSSVDLNSMTPIAAADALYDRIMRAVSRGDSVEAQQFMPMALDAYEIARPLAADGLFHLSLLQRTAMRLDDAFATAQEILTANPDHLLGLSAAGEVLTELGRADEAVAHYQHIVDIYDAQMGAALPEYLDHGGITETLKDDAEAFLAGR
jgi:Double zinc ribbon